MRILIGLLITTLPNKEAKKRYIENIKRITWELKEIEWNEYKRRKIINDKLGIYNKTQH